jgi:brefeldin A-inhibited guanine nucleotide-exchange protein
LLSSIFDDISGNEIVLEEEREEAERNKREKAVDERERNDMYKREMAQMQKKSQALMMQKSAKSAGRSPLTSSSTAMSKATEEGQLVFRPATNPDLARSMFKTACWPFLAAFSLMFENEGSLEDAAGNLEDGAAQAKFDAQIWDIAAGKVAGAKGRAAASADGSISSVALSLRGMAGCVRVAGIFKLETERNAFVSSLAKMTCLSKVPEMRARNVKAVKTLITMASVIGEYLDSSWLDVLKCISLLERTQLIEARSAFGVGPDTEQPAARSIQTQPSLLQSIFDGDDDTVSDGSSPRLSSGGAQGKSSFSGAVVLPSDQSKAASLDLLVKQIQSQDTLVAIDRIFSSTVQLSGTGVQAFFRSLCEVSAEEVGISPEYVAASIKPLSETTGIQSQPSILVSATPSSSSLSSLFSTGGSGARMYSLQKVVEVAYYNMFRSGCWIAFSMLMIPS